MRAFGAAVLGITLLVSPVYALHLPLNSISCSRADTLLRLPVNNDFWKDEQLSQRDSSAALHPDAFWEETPVLGYQGWMTYGPIGISEGDENPHLAVTNDPSLQKWGEFVSGGDTLHNPVFDTSDFHAAHLSDQDLVIDPATHTPVLGYRVSWGIAHPDSVGLYISRTQTGLTWDTTCVLKSKTSELISPAWIVDTTGSCGLYCVEMAAQRDGRENRIVRYTAPALAAEYTLDDTCRIIWGARIDSTRWDIWHINAFRIDDQLLMDVTLCPEDSTGGCSDRADFTTVQILMESLDNGHSWTMADDFHLNTRTAANQPDSCAVWDAAGTYRAAIVPQQRGDCIRFAYLYTGRLWNACSEGNFSRKWGIGLTWLRFDGVDSIDSDTDRITDCFDNCVSAYNPRQEDTDRDLIGDACDLCTADSTNDVDLDGICGLSDNCPAIANSGQDDTDHDGLGDACDNCPNTSNAGQADTDADGIGDVCCCVRRGDVNSDGGVFVNDLSTLVRCLFCGESALSCPAHGDFNGDTRITVADLSYLVSYLFREGYPPHPCP